MTVEQSIRFSVLPMLFLLGFCGLREKYCCVNDASGLCQGVYARQTIEDAEKYTHSIAMRFMTNRSVPGSVSFRVVDQQREKYGLFRLTHAAV